MIISSPRPSLVRAPEPASLARSYGAYLAVGAVAAGAIVVSLPSLAIQLVAVAGAGMFAAGVLLARLGRVLNPAWVILAGIYLIAPVGTVLLGLNIGVSTAIALTLAPGPFVLVAVITHPWLWRRLVLLTPLLALLAYAGLSLAWSPDAAYGSEKLTTWLLTSLVPVAFIILLVPESPKIGWWLVGGAAFIYATWLLVFGQYTDLFPGRLVIFGTNPIWEARAVFIGAVVVIFGRFPLIVRLVSVPVMVLAGLLTVSLGPALGLVVGVWAGAGNTLRRADRTDPRVGLGWAIFGLTTGLGLVLFIADTFGTGTSILATLGSDPNISSRGSYLGASVGLFAQSPLLGIGLGGFAATGLDTYPHNLLAEILSELGIVGLLAFVPWTVLAIRGAAGSPLLVALVATTGTYFLFSGSLASNVEFFLFSAVAVARLPVGTRPAQAVSHTTPTGPSVAQMLAVSRHAT
ncbi:MAG TPA: O-antigen ligase family protein [Candidatus Acidoferrum sp.]|nr:O-antigen ligase family protein [Candidatus Acidoferrum sp.]